MGRQHTHDYHGNINNRLSIVKSLGAQALSYPNTQGDSNAECYLEFDKHHLITYFYTKVSEQSDTQGKTHKQKQ